MNLTPAQKAWRTRRARARQQVQVPDIPVILDEAIEEGEVELIDLVLPQRSTKHQVRKSLAGLGRLLTAAVEEPRDRKRAAPLRNTGNETIVALLSDLHFGKLIMDEYDGKIVTFNIEVGVQRIRHIMDRVADLALSREADELVVLLGGDLIDGEGIYATQASHLEQSAIEQVKGTATGLFNECRYLHELTGLPVRIISCPGNHGRVTRYTDEMTNWDQQIAIMIDLMTELVDDPIFVEYPRTRQFIIGEIKGHKVLLRHKAKRGSTAAPQSQWYNWLVQHDWDIAAAGHWHAPGLEFIADRPVFRNGSLCGKDDFAESLGLGDGAAQWVWGMDDEKAMTFAELVTFEDLNGPQ